MQVIQYIRKSTAVLLIVSVLLSLQASYSWSQIEETLEEGKPLKVEEAFKSYEGGLQIFDVNSNETLDFEGVSAPYFKLLNFTHTDGVTYYYIDECSYDPNQKQEICHHLLGDKTFKISEIEERLKKIELSFFNDPKKGFYVSAFITGILSATVLLRTTKKCYYILNPKFGYKKAAGLMFLGLLTVLVIESTTNITPIQWLAGFMLGATQFAYNKFGLFQNKQPDVLWKDVFQEIMKEEKTYTHTSQDAFSSVYLFRGGSDVSTDQIREIILKNFLTQEP